MKKPNPNQNDRGFIMCMVLTWHLIAPFIPVNAGIWIYPQWVYWLSYAQNDRAKEIIYISVLYYIPYFFLELLDGVDDSLFFIFRYLRSTILIFLYEFEYSYDSLITHIVRYFSRSMSPTLRGQIDEPYIAPEYSSTFLQEFSIIWFW